jgi:hypothetical protein
MGAQAEGPAIVPADRASAKKKRQNKRGTVKAEGTGSDDDAQYPRSKYKTGNAAGRAAWSAALNRDRTDIPAAALIRVSPPASPSDAPPASVPAAGLTEDEKNLLRDKSAAIAHTNLMYGNQAPSAPAVPPVPVPSGVIDNPYIGTGAAGHDKSFLARAPPAPHPPSPRALYAELREEVASKNAETVALKEKLSQTEYWMAEEAGRYIRQSKDSEEKMVELRKILESEHSRSQLESENSRKTIEGKDSEIVSLRGDVTMYFRKEADLNCLEAKLKAEVDKNEYEVTWRTEEIVRLQSYIDMQKQATDREKEVLVSDLKKEQQLVLNEQHNFTQMEASKLNEVNRLQGLYDMELKTSCDKEKQYNELLERMAKEHGDDQADRLDSLQADAAISKAEQVKRLTSELSRLQTKVELSEMQLSQAGVREMRLGRESEEYHKCKIALKDSEEVVKAMQQSMTSEDAGINSERLRVLRELDGLTQRQLLKEHDDLQQIHSKLVIKNIKSQTKRKEDMKCIYSELDQYKNECERLQLKASEELVNSNEQELNIRNELAEVKRLYQLAMGEMTNVKAQLDSAETKCLELQQSSPEYNPGRKAHQVDMTPKRLDSGTRFSAIASFTGTGYCSDAAFCAGTPSHVFDNGDHDGSPAEDLPTEDLPTHDLAMSREELMADSSITLQQAVTAARNKSVHLKRAIKTTDFLWEGVRMEATELVTIMQKQYEKISHTVKTHMDLQNGGHASVLNLVEMEAGVQLLDLVGRTYARKFISYNGLQDEDSRCGRCGDPSGTFAGDHRTDVGTSFI